jgi:alpha-beta hydrolase superfamily lysophospholipase
MPSGLPPLADGSTYPAHPPLPEGFEYKTDFDRFEGKMGSSTGVGQLWFAYFTPVKVAAKGLVIFVHGMHEHTERYHHNLAELASRGYVAGAVDYIGHGRSPGERGDINSIDQIIPDIKAFIKLMRDKVGHQLPLFIWGQSLGGGMTGLMGIDDCKQRDGRSIAGIVATSGAFGVDMNIIIKIQNFFSPIIRRIAPKARIVDAVRPSEMCSDPVEVERYEKDPLNTIGNLRVNFALVAKAVMDYVSENNSALQTPCLVIHGDADKCTHMASAEEFVKKASSTDKEFVIMPGYYHTLLHEPRRAEVMAKMIDFFDRIVSQSGGQASIRSAL